MTSEEGRISATWGDGHTAKCRTDNFTSEQYHCSCRKKPAKQWHGSVPEECDLCSGSIEDTFIDGATRMGPWANMCLRCHRTYGVGLGTGRGQKYALGASDKWWKVEG